VVSKLSPVTYRLRLPSSYRLHPVLNIAHLEPYHSSPQRFGERPVLPHIRSETAAEEWEIEGIVAERSRKRGARRIPQFRVRYVGYGPEHDEWVPRSFLRNASDVLNDWEHKTRGEKEAASSQAAEHLPEAN
jgi:hypothetical protein